MDAFQKSHVSSNGCQVYMESAPLQYSQAPESLTYFELKLSSHVVPQRSWDWMLKHASITVHWGTWINFERTATKCQREDATHLPHHFQVFSSSCSSMFRIAYHPRDHPRDHANVLSVYSMTLSYTYLPQIHHTCWIWSALSKGEKVWKSQCGSHLTRPCCSVGKKQIVQVWMRPLHI